ncbi:MAG TPA: FAD-binding oxidoreductase [Streptosporangiaceae bacterium]
MAVIGAGIVGSSVGWHLARRGARVVMIDACEPGTGVTNWSVGWVNASNKTQTREYFDLNVAGMAACRELALELGPGDWWNLAGHLRWTDNPASAQALHLAVEQLCLRGYEAEIWKAKKVRDLLEPHICFPDDDTEVAFYPGEGWINGRTLAERLVQGARDCGAETHFGSVLTDVVVEGDRITGVVLSDGQHLRVDAVVNAAGPAGAKVASLVGRTLPMREEPGLLARVRCDPVPIRRVMHAPHVELRPDGPRLAVLHSREIDSLIESSTSISDLSGRLCRLASDVVPALDASEFVEAQIAWRPIPVDGLPSVGAASDISGYYEAVTHSGITLGAIVGRVLAQEIVDGTVDDLIAPYRPDRFTDAGTPSATRDR